ncbi:Segregation and condensation complex subunit ScpB [uncultured archaeon]|nr:Segregation and condensation complex subunit ScpB [uncultured archaeon]
MAKSKMYVYVKPRSGAPAVEKKAEPPPVIDVEKLEMPQVREAGRKKKGQTSRAAGGSESQMPAAPPEIQISSPEQLTLELGEKELVSAPPRNPPQPAPMDPESTPAEPGSLETVQAGDNTASEENKPIVAENSVSSAPTAAPAPDNSLSSEPMPASVLDPLRVLEAALFMSSSAMPAQDLGKLVGIGAVGHVSSLLTQLSIQYEQSGSSLEVVEENPGKWAMRIRAAFAPSVRRFAGEAEIPKHALRTLAYVSRHEGITKRDLFKRLGGTIYEDCAELIDKGFVQAKPSGRTMSLSTTPKFRQYFQG